jgi:hypothetical protein
VVGSKLPATATHTSTELLAILLEHSLSKGHLTVFQTLSMSNQPGYLMYLLPELSESTKYVDLPAFHEIRRKALGFDNARHIVVRLWKDCNHQVVRFCLHLHHVDAPVNHTPWVMTKGQPPPCRSFCGPPNRLIHQLNRFVWGYFEDGVNRNANVMFWDMLDDFLRDIHHRCVCCGTELGTGNSLLRSAACSRACSIGVRSSELEVRCPELGFDRDGAYGLVIAAKHAIEKRHYDHIQPLPLRLSEQVIEYRLSVNHSSLWTIVTSPTLWDSDTKVLIAWILTGYRGCFVSTQRSDMELQGIFPNLGQQADVFLVNSKPEIEKSFARTVQSGGYTSIVYHVTSFDRLYPILWEGLQVLSNTSLEQHGVFYGSGIYAARESCVAARYAVESKLPSLRFQNLVLLVCELIRPRKYEVFDPVTHEDLKIYCITKPGDIIVRAVVTAEKRSCFKEIDSLAFQQYLRSIKNTH